MGVAYTGLGNSVVKRKKRRKDTNGLLAVFATIVIPSFKTVVRNEIILVEHGSIL